MTKKRTTAVLLATVILLSVFFRFAGTAGTDIQSDHALNSFRALGLVDYLADANQTTPLVWFGMIPWWSRLSFHDHPPLSFELQHLFFLVFGNTDVAAYMPFLLAGIISTYMIWRILLRRTDAVSATVGSLFLSIGSYSVWMSITGYIEGIEVLGIIAAIAFLLRLLESEGKRYSFALMASLGLALLTKYTALFLIPCILLSIAWLNTKLLKQKKFWLSWLLAIVLLLPVIIYNVFVFKTRGHFDAAISSMLGMHTADYQALWNRGINLNLVENLRGIGSIFTHNNAYPTVLLLAVLLGWGIVSSARRTASNLTTIATIGIICSLGMFAVSGAQTRFLTISLPLFALLLGSAYFELRRQPFDLRAPALIILMLVGFTETAYSMNTNLLPQPLGTAGVAYGADRFFKRGYYELDQYLRATAYGTLPARKQIISLADTKVGVDPTFDTSIIIDGRMDWFSQMWYFRRYQFYYDRPIVSISFILQNMHAEGWNNNIFTYLQAKGAKHVWLVTMENAAAPADENAASYARYLASLGDALQRAEIAPHIIYDYAERPAFNVYEIKF